MSGPLQHAGSDVTTSADRDEDGDDMDDDELDPQDPEVGLLLLEALLCHGICIYD